MTKQSFVAVQFERFFSMDSAKAIKAQEYGYLNAINYMAPHKSAGVGNLCSHASPVCIELCLGLESGQASMVSRSGIAKAPSWRRLLWAKCSCMSRARFVRPSVRI